MATINQRTQLQKTGTTFYGMETPENGVEQIFVVGTLLKIDQLFREQLKDFPGFDQKVLKNLFISIETHPLAPSKTKTGQ